jgi:hypothetical protein
MNELRALRRIRPEIEPLDEATFEGIWGSIIGIPEQRSESPRQPDPDLGPLFALETAPNSSARRRLLTVAAAVLVVIGVGAVVGVRAVGDESNQPAATAQPPADTGSTNSDAMPPSTTEEAVLLLPTADIEPNYVQHNAALAHRTRGLVRAPDGSTLSINLLENDSANFSADVEQRGIGGLVWAALVEDNNRGYVTLDACNMLSLNAGPHSAEAWDANAVDLMNAVQFTDSLTIDLPDDWQVIEIGTVGDWYSMSFASGIEGVPGVTLTQMPGSNAGPLLADLAGRPITAVTIDGSPAWQIPMQEAGWTQTIWQNDSGSMMLTSNGLAPERIDQFLTELTPASAADWHARYNDQDVGRDMTMPIPSCGPLTVSVNNPDS